MNKNKKKLNNLLEARKQCVRMGCKSDLQLVNYMIAKLAKKMKINYEKI
jgi:hypothetical protein